MTSLLMLATTMIPAGAPDIENPKERFLPARKKGSGPTRESFAPERREGMQLAC
jgi:hypothetical protein